MQEQYNPQKIESKIQRYWEENKVFKVTENESKEKYYCLSYVPRPERATPYRSPAELHYW